MEEEEFMWYKVSLSFFQNQKGRKSTDNFLFMTVVCRCHSWQCMSKVLIMLHSSSV